MKIGFAGNTNNYPFMLALAFQRLGHEVVFLVDSSSRLHRPENYATDDQIASIRIIDSPGIINKFFQYIFWNKKLKEVTAELQSCDFLIVNDLWPVIARKLEVPYLVLLTGSDLEYFGDYRCVWKDYWKQSTDVFFLKRIFRVSLACYVSMLQRRGIKQAKAINYFPEGIVKNGDRILKSLGHTKFKRLNFMMTDVVKHQMQPFPDNQTLRILVAARQSWSPPPSSSASELDYKGADIFIKGAAQFIKKTGKKIEIVLVKKGPDIQKSLDLIQELKIESAITWLNEMTQKELVEEYLKSDLIVDQLSNGMVGMVGLDALAMGRPLIANGRPEIWDPLLGTSSPICQAKSPEEVCAQIEYLFDRVNREVVANKSREYAVNFFSSDAAAKICLKAMSDA